MSDPIRVFDRHVLRARRDRAAPTLSDHDFLYREVAERLADRLDDVVRKFPRALDLGCHTGQFAEIVGGRGGIATLVQCDLSEAMVRRTGGQRLVADEEALPFAAASFDLVVSVMSLHWVNDLPGTLAQIRRILKPDGLFLAAMAGAGTLGQLREAMMQAELEVEGGASPRVSPFTDVRDAGALLQRAGFALPVVDAEPIEVRYREPARLLDDLRGMGETNAVAERRRVPLRRRTLVTALDRYRAAHTADDGRVPARFEIVMLHGWAPHESQRPPLRPGSATASLADALRIHDDPDDTGEGR